MPGETMTTPAENVVADAPTESVATVPTAVGDKAPSTVDSIGKPSRQVLFPVDNSEYCEHAFVWYIQNLYRTGDKVLFVHVAEPIYTPASSFSLAMETVPIMLTDTRLSISEGVETAKQLLHKYIAQAKGHGIESRATVFVNNQPGQSLVTCAKEDNVDVIVMANRGMGLLRRTFLGSVSDYVMHHAHMPVIIVPPSK